MDTLHGFIFFSLILYWIISTIYKKIDDLFCSVHISGLWHSVSNDDESCHFRQFSNVIPQASVSDFSTRFCLWSHLNFPVINPWMATPYVATSKRVWPRGALSIFAIDYTVWILRSVFAPDILTCSNFRHNAVYYHDFFPFFFKFSMPSKIAGCLWYKSNLPD